MKDLEQPLIVSFSSSPQTMGGEERDGGWVEEEGREELEEEDAVLNSSSHSCTFSSPSLSLSISPLVSSVAPAEASSPALRPRSVSAPGSASMTRIFSLPVVSCSITFWQNTLQLIDFVVVLAKFVKLLGIKSPYVLNVRCVVQEIPKEDSKCSLRITNIPQEILSLKE